LYTKDGTYWSLLDQDKTNGGTLDDSAVWSSATYDISSWGGSRIRVAFTFDSVDPEFNQFPGWYIDDFSIDAETGTSGNWTIGGYLGVGTDSPQRAVHLKGPNAVFRMDRTQDTAAFLLLRIDDWGNVLKNFGVGVDSSGPNQGQFRILDFGGGVGGAAQPRMTIANDGSTILGGSLTATQFFQTSALRFKQNIHPVENALLKLARLRGVQFDWKSGRRSSVGFVAEEVAEVLPEAVSRESDSTTILGLSYDNLIALQLEALRSQGEQLQSLRIKRDELLRLLKELEQANHNQETGRKE